jgi:hypothetical protein
MLRRLIAIAVLLCCIFVPVLSHADDLGEYIMIAIREGAKPTDASLILLTRDLKFYEKNMHLLPAEIQQRVQSLRVQLASNAVQTAALEMKEAESLFGATGSWNPGRDMDVIYFGKNGDAAAVKVASAYERASENMMSALVPNDPILKMYREFRKGAPAFEIPGRLTADSMAMVTTQLPDFGYGDLDKAYKNARDILARGGSKEEVMAQFNKQVREAMAQNFRAHFDTSTHPDYYRGASGQDWFKQTYLENPDKMRTFAVDPDSGSVVLKKGGINAVPEEVAKRLGFGSFQGGRLRFTKIASDYALFFSHAKSGAADNAKYAVRIFNELDFDIIKDISDEDMKLLCVSELIANKPEKASAILAEAGLTGDDLQKGLSKILHTWTETHLLRDAERLVNELKAIGQTADDIDKLFAEARLKMNLNEMITGLDALKQAPKDVREKLIKALQSKFAGDEAGEKVIRFIMKRLELFSDTGELARRIIKVLQELGQISDADARAALKELDAGNEITGALGDKVKRARKEIMVLSAGGAVEFDDALDMDRLMEDWRKSQPSAQLQSPSPELKKILRDIDDPPSPSGGGSGGGLKSLGLTDEEVRLQMAFKEKMAKAPAMKSIRQKLPLKLSKSGITLRQFQAKLREIMFNPAYVQLGDASMSVGFFDGVMGAAAGLYQTYDILFNRSLTPEEENLELGNAWVTALPIVGDFAQGLITGGQAWYEGDKGKALEAGLWISIGVMGCVPGGQLPAVIAGISLATKPLVAGAYDARQAQNLVQAWVESGDWAMDEKPRRLKGLFDREKNVHAIAYKDLLTETGNKPYKSELADGLLGIDVTINDSIRAYAEQYVMPQYTAITSMRDGLRNLYPDFKDKDWTDEFTAKYKIEVRGGKGGLALFHAYYLIRTKALEQTIAQLKSWAEDEMRAAKDYDAEVTRLKGELQALQDELKCPTLIQHAEDSVEAYSRVIKNVWEQESLPLSKLRIYEHYVKTYRTIAGKLRRVNDLFRECSAPFAPSSWHLTGFPEFDVDRVNTLLSSMENGRKSVVEYIEKLLKDFDQPVTKYDPSNECHKKTFDVLAPLRYKVAFVENLILYYKQLADGESTWGSAYDAAKQRYAQQRDALMKQAAKSSRDLVESAAFSEAFMTYVASIPYGLASKESDLYRSTARDYEVRLPGDQKEYEMATWTTGTGGKTLQGCLLAALKVEITLSESQPEEGQEIKASVRLTGGTPPKENYWHWKTSGGLTPSSRAGQEITVRVASEGTVTVELLDYFDTKLAKVLTTASAAVKPKKKEGKKDDKKDDKKDGVVIPPVAPGTDKADPGKAAKYVPACSYTYSAWGECSRATKKQTRTVTGKEPQGCVEKGKPALEQGCTPPPSEEDKKNAYLNCLCRCSSGWAGHIGVWYDPEGKSVPECKSSGPCFGGAGAFGCTRRHFFGGPSDCAKGCWESAFGKGTYDPGKADKLRKDENKKYKKPLTLTIKASKNPADFGDIVDLTAETAEGSGGYKWTWGGCAQDAKDDRAKVLNSRQCKPCTATVTATDQDGDSASASLEVKCTALRVKLTKETPRESTIPIGGKATFLAEVFSGDKPASGSFSYIWERNPDALFGDPKNPTYETKGGSQSRNTATFKKMGTTPVWVSVLKEVDGRKMTVGESEQIPIQAVSPKLKLSVNKKEPLIGEKVVITVHEEPAMSNDIITFWWEIKGDAANPGPEPNIPNSRSYSFKPKNVKPVTVTVHGKAKEDGSDLGQADVTVNPKGYTVTIGEPRYLGPKPKIWKCDTQLGGACPGLVDVGDRQFAVHHDVFMKATVAPALSGARYRWSIDPAGTCGTPGAGDEIKMNCSDTGTFTVSLKVASSDGDQVGEASRSVTISVSQKDLDGSKKAKEAQEKIQKAKGLVAEGKLDEGIALANEAAGLDPKNAEAKSLAQKWGNEKQTVTQQLDKTRKLITENQFDQAEKEFAPAQKLHPKYPPVVETDKLLKTKKDEYKKNVAGKLAGAKDKARKGDYDGAIKDAEDAAKFDPSNKDAAATARKLRQEKETIHQQIGKAKKLMDENKFADAQKELIVASNLNGYYQPLQQANQELGTRWNKYNAEVRDKVYEVRSANEKKDFGKALEIAAAWRASTKLDPYAEKELKQQEDWAKQWKAQKDKQIGVLKAAGEKVKSYDYAGALKQYDEGFANGQNIYNGTEPEYKEAVELRSQAFTKNKRLGELIPWVRKAAEDKEYLTVDALQNILKTADEAIALQPNNQQLKTWRGQIVARAEKTKADNDRTAAGRKYLDAARSEENTYLSQLSGTQGRQGQWGEKLEGDMQSHIQKAIDNYRESLKYIPDAAVEKKIKDLETTLEGRKKSLENYRLSLALKNEADTLSQQATKDPDIQSASPKYDEAIAKYRKSLSLYRPFNAESVEKAITNLETYKHERWVKKYWADGQAVEKEGKVVEAIGIYDKAIASFHPTVPQNDRMYIIVHQQDLKNRVTAAKNWRADGEAKQKAGKIGEAIASYKQSLALLPDAALAEHVRMLEGKQAEAGEKKASADKLWQEGTALFNQGRSSDALTKFKSSLGYWSDATRTKYVADMEARRSKAVSLREQGAGLQGQKRIPEAIAKYKESLTYWPDPALTAHIAALEKSRTGVQPPTVVSGGVDGAWEVSFNNYRGKMELQRSSSRWSGRLWLDAHQKWEQLTTISYDPGTGRLEFTRPISGATQRYSGVLSADKLEGTFTQQNSSGKYTWWAKRTAAGAIVSTGSGSTESPQVSSSPYYHVDLTPYGGKKGTPRKVKSIEVDDGSWIRLKATHEKKLRLDIPLPQRVAASAVAVVSNLDNAHNVPDKMTTTVLTVHTTSGDRTFEFKAGVHSSEWNRSETGGATHAWPKETNIGGPRWMAVFSLPAGSVVTGLRFDHRDTDKKYYHGDAAPGFCLRGITLVGTGGAAAVTTGGSTAAVQGPAINIVGRWKTETIEGGKVDVVSTTVFNRDGSYTMDVSGEELAGVAVCTIRGSYTLSGQTLNLRPSGSQCKFKDGTTRSEPVDKYDTISGRVSGNDRSFTYLPGGNVSVRYTRQ